jgi:MerR family transcriptional regulator/heat shock protein HspR
MSNVEFLGEINDPVISIGILAQKVGLSVSAVRKYENEGLVIAHRTPSGHRLFSHEDIERVRYIHYLIQDLGLNIEAIRRIQALLPCWDLLPCSEERRKICPAYQERARPCWMIKGLSCTPQGNECRRCDIYRFGSLCTQDIKRVVHDQTDCQDAGVAIKKLIQRRRHLSKKEN